MTDTSTPPDQERNRERFELAYAVNLAEDIRGRPREYAYPPERAPEVARKMVAGLLAGTANKDSRVLRRLATRYGRPFTYAGLRACILEGPAA